MLRRGYHLTLFGTGICILLLGCSSKKSSERPITTTGNPADLGNMLQFGFKTHVFKLINMGNEPVSVTKLVNGCVCTRSKLNNNPIAPGGSTDVTVELYSNDREGHFASKVTVFWKTANDSHTGKFDLLFQADQSLWNSHS